MSSAKAQTYDERDRQGKALEAWHRQQAQWAATEKALAKKVGKDPDHTLPGTVHHFRLRQEELGMIDASVPAEIKNGISAWEMNLRSSSGGVRYVQIGSSYPYPLYCPIRDVEAVKPDNHILMRVIPDHVPPRDKPVSEGEYFKAKQGEFKKHVKKKFAHFVSNPEPLHVIGKPPPLTKTRVKDDGTIEPVVFYPYESKSGTATPRQPTPPPHGVETPISMLPVDRPQSRPLSAVSGGQKSVQDMPVGQQEGPMLMFSTAHLSFTTQPNVAANATLKVSNIGSTAVFYSWSPCEMDSIFDDKKAKGASAEDGNQGSSEPAVKSTFRLSAPNDGVFLPDDECCFTFMFRSTTPGAFMQQYELLTVPAGKERIIVQLRGVVLSADSDALGTSKLSAAMNARAMKEDLHNLFTEILTTPSGNKLDEAHYRMLVEERQQEAKDKVNEEVVLQETRQKVWTENNVSLGLPFNEHVYEKIHQLHRQYHLLQSKMPSPPQEAQPTRVSPTPDLKRPGSAAQRSDAQTPGGTLGQGASLQDLLNKASPASSDAAGVALPAWNGSVRSFLEDLTSAKDIQARTSFINALTTLTDAAAFSEDPKEPLKDLLRKASAKRAWDEAIEGIHNCSATARDMAEGRGTLKNAGGKDKNEKGKGAKKPAAPAKGDKGAAPTERSIEDNAEAKAEYDALFQNLSRRIVGDTVQNILTLQENAAHTIETMCDREASVMLAWRMPEILKRAAEPEVDLDPVLEANPKGKKK